jgi:predicted O-methyltransferase YrrM
VRRIAHWTPRYVLDRLQVAAHHRRHRHQPWLTRQSVRLIDKLLRPGDRGLEWGAGRSSLWLAARLSHLLTIEDDPVWATRIARQACAQGIDGRLDIRLLSCSGDASSPYVRVVDSLDTASIDVCLIDGRLREHCFLGVLPKLRRGALLILDNSNWYLPHDPVSRAPGSRTRASGPSSPYWAAAAAEVADWRVLWTTDGVCDTSIWIKP